MKNCILSVLLFFASAGLCAESIQSPEVLTNKIEQHVLNELSSYKEGKVQVTADKIDSRLNLKACADDQLVVFNPYQSPLLNTSTLGIKCQEIDNRWSLYVPIRITIMKTVYVTRRALIKGTRLTDDDIYLTEMDVQKLTHGYFNKGDNLIGQICTQGIPPNSPLNPHNIETAKLVNKGERVAITVNNNNLSISMDGIAVEEGSLGETIRVKNLSSKKIIEAQITDKKKVTVVL